MTYINLPNCGGHSEQQSKLPRIFVERPIPSFRPEGSRTYVAISRHSIPMTLATTSQIGLATPWTIAKEISGSQPWKQFVTLPTSCHATVSVERVVHKLRLFSWASCGHQGNCQVMQSLYKYVIVYVFYLSHNYGYIIQHGYLFPSISIYLQHHVQDMRCMASSQSSSSICCSFSLPLQVLHCGHNAVHAFFRCNYTWCTDYFRTQRCRLNSVKKQLSQTQIAQKCLVCSGETGSPWR